MNMSLPRRTDSESGYKPTHTDILSFIHQCVQCGKDQVSL
jgi:hypothetical protein